MPYHGDWYIVHKVIEARFWGQVTVEETDIHNDVCVQLLTEAQALDPDNTIYLLFDAGEVDSFPPLYLRFAQGLRVLRFQNRGTMFLVVRNSAIRSIFEVTAHISRHHLPLRVFQERQEAIDAIETVLEKNALRR
jgi:hypothetical protein